MHDPHCRQSNTTSSPMRSTPASSVITRNPVKCPLFTFSSLDRERVHAVLPILRKHISAPAPRCTPTVSSRPPTRSNSSRTNDTNTVLALHPIGMGNRAAVASAAGRALAEGRVVRDAPAAALEVALHFDALVPLQVPAPAQRRAVDGAALGAGRAGTPDGAAPAHGRGLRDDGAANGRYKVGEWAGWRRARTVGRTYGSCHQW